MEGKRNASGQDIKTQSGISRNVSRQPAILPGRYLLLTLLLLLLPTACGAATVTPPPAVFIEAAGSTSMTPLLVDLAAAYTGRHQNVTFDIQGGGSGLGQRLVETGQVDLGLVSWPPQELANDMRLAPIARDAVAIVLHPENRSKGLSIVELRNIFSGRLLNWQEVDSPGGFIQVVSREDGSGTRAAFETLVMDGQAVTPTAIVLPNNRAVVEFVAENRDAVGYVSLAFVGEGVYVVPVEGVAPSLDMLASGSYPLSRDLSLMVPRQGAGEVNKFVDFVLSPAGQAIASQRWGRVR